MNTQLVWDNALAYSLQVAILIAAIAPVPALLRLRLPAARLLFWRTALAACVLLPALQPWTREVIVIGTGLTNSPWRALTPRPVTVSWSLIDAALWILAAGMALRGIWLCLGLMRLRRYRRSAQPLAAHTGPLRDLLTAWAPRAYLTVSADVTGPVTFGVLRPVVLLPARFPHLPDSMQYAIVCHELLHVYRHDWLYTVAEEIVRAVLWFHPAIWWLLGQIQLTREQTVDREVLRVTQSPNDYVDALLAVAGAKPQLDLAPAPLFLRKRHLKRRVVAILEDIPMSKTRIVPALAAGLATLAAACWLAVSTFPLAASPQLVADAEGVAVDAGSAVLAHRTAVDYPESARRKGVQGTVTVELTLSAEGTVTDARVIGGPEELRRPVLQSALQWHFTRSSGPSVKTISVLFRSPAPGAETAPPRVMANPSPSMIRSLEIRGLSQPAEDELRAKLPIREGGVAQYQQMLDTVQVLREFDEHLLINFNRVSGTGEFRVQIYLANSQEAAAAEPAPPPPPPAGVERLRIGGNLQQQKLINKPRPVYPPLAKQERIQGAVKLQVVIDREGNVAYLSVISGHPLLVPSATDAVRQWTYAKTLLNGNPVEVLTQVDVNYTLMP